MATNKPKNTKKKRNVVVVKVDPQKIAKTDKSKHSVFSLADKLRERKRLNQQILKSL